MDDQKRRRWTWEETTVSTLNEDGTIGRLSMRHCRHKFGEFPWDEWEARARASGVTEELVLLGRAVIREANQHCWSAQLQRECGWDDDGDAMIELALRDPARAKRRWSWLLDSDGDPEALS